MKNILYILLAAFILSSCHPSIRGNGVVKRETRKVSSFSELDVNNSFTVHLKQGNDPSLIVEADENLHEHILSSSHGNELSIHADANFLKYKKLDLYITVPNLEELEISGACSVKGEGVIRSSKLDINSSGASELELEVEAGELEMDISGASEIRLRGRAEKLNIDASGACEVKAFDFKATNGNIDVSGASQLDIYVTGKLNIEASGASEIRYKGTPENLSQKAGGASEVKSYSN